MSKNKTININGIEITILQTEQDDFTSFTDIKNIHE